MIPAARIAAAIEILDMTLTGEPVDKVLPNWGRANRYAGSGDRAAIRDHVFDALRCRRSFAWLGGAETGRGLMLGLARAQELEVNALFSGNKFAPPVLDEAEQDQPDIAKAPRAVQLDCPDWLQARFDDDLGENSSAILTALQTRAPVFLRANAAKGDRATAIEALAKHEVQTQPHDLSPTAIEVTKNPRRVAASDAYADGLVELQDAASQAVVDFLPLDASSKVLDFCAGGGGKSLGIAARGVTQIVAHDAIVERMKDLPVRAERAGANIEVAEPEALTGREFDLVLCDVPCSGSGSWRRKPEAKWTLTPERLLELTSLQGEILRNAAPYTKIGGTLAYVTCSLFESENRTQIDAFLADRKGWQLVKDHRFSPLQGGDGFYLALLTRVS
ncbi:MAG: RsmB/NOP family class I SAM-dependent RNA methyltransferase [Marinosulfonomonas sp.]|nr:RsmB/NOP family class I SAM-dependent RNA methyltransferase [Marinosulfonomonas sp.]